MEKVKKSLNKLLKYLEGLMDDLYENDLSQINGNSVIATSTVLDIFGTKNLVDSIISNSESWIRVDMKDSKYMTEDLPRIVKENGSFIDSKIFTTPFDAIITVSKSEEWVDVDKDFIPITDDDINKIWNHMIQVIKSICVYVHLERKPIKTKDGYKYSMAGEYPGFELEKYVKMFNVELS